MKRRKRTGGGLRRQWREGARWAWLASVVVVGGVLGFVPAWLRRRRGTRTRD